MNIALIALIFLILFAIIIIVSLLYERKTHIVAAPTMPWVRKIIIASIRDQHNSNTPLKIAELGSGWGGLSYAVAHAYPNANIHGFELSPFPFWFSRARQILSNKSVSFRRTDFFKEDLSSYNLIICYLSPKHMEWLKDKFEKELNAGTLIISNAFPIVGWNPVSTKSTQHGININVYTYSTL